MKRIARPCFHTPELMRLAAFTAVLLFATGAFAHSVGTSYVAIEQQEDGTKELAVRVDLSLRDLEFAVGLDANHDGRVTWSEVSAREQALMTYVTNRLHIGRGARPCVFGASDMLVDHHSDGAYAVLMIPLRCPTHGKLALQSELLFDIDDSHRSLLRIDIADVHIVSVLTSGTRTWAEPTDRSGRFLTLVRFIEQGIWHIWTGFDHLAFLMLLLLPLMRRQQDSKSSLMIKVLRIVTAFTVAHSVTLGLAAFNYVRLPSRWVEAAIAASIIATGLANLFPRTARFSVVMAFGFGLIHGLGFAAALAELSANAASRLLPLIGFNLGVELGQLVVVSALFPILFLGARAVVVQERLAAVGSVSIALLGVIWLVQRAVVF